MGIQTNARTNRLVQFAVTTALATTALSGCTGKVAPPHAYSAEKAGAALAKGKASKAVDHAEAAVLAAPRDAYTRTLLGNAYLQEGRFQSAATTLAEAVELGDTASRTVISFALAQAASGKQAEAIETLRRFENAINRADFGLAIALAGRPEEGVHVLGNALRSGQNTAKVRQNLAYSYAMLGNWKAARLMVAEDVPADQVGRRLSEWAAMIAPEQFSLRVASLLGVQIAADPGQPAHLALVNHPSVEMMAAETQEEPVAEQPNSDFALAKELPPVKSTTQIDDRDEAALTEAPEGGAIRFVSREVAQTVPQRTNARVESRQSPVKAAVAARPETSPTTGGYSIQLGSFSSQAEAQDAWKIFQARYPDLVNAERIITKARVNGKIYYRVAATGYARASAAAMCRQVERKGGGCMAYASNRTLPGSLGPVKEDVRVAAR